MFEVIRRSAMTLSILVVVGGLAFYFYAVTGGSSDWAAGSYEPVRFASLRHNPAGTAFLACSNPACGSTEADTASILLNAPLATVRQQVAQITDTGPRFKMLSFDIVNSQFEIGEQIPGKPFYGIVSVLLLPYGETKTEMIVYAYQPVGAHQKGDNVARADEIIQTIQAQTGSL